MGAGTQYVINLEQPFQVEQGVVYELTFDLTDGQGAISLYGDSPANESSWDDGLPLPLNGLSGYGSTSGIYRGDLNFEMYWDDNAAKLQRFETMLDQTDYILISSNRQWGSIPRVPERYPLSTAYYRDLLGCPADKDLLWCYQVAQPDSFQGKLGFKLVAVFQSDPSLGPIDINDQSAEEAFTVYDHPKVLIFQKQADYDPQQVRSLLGAVDLSHVIHLTPRQASQRIMTLNLPATLLAIQQAGGTWSQLFNYADLQNRFQALGVILWYLTISLLGLLMYPIVRLALPGLPDKGYPLVRTAGMISVAYLVWLAGSLQVPFTRLTISLALLLLALGGATLAYRQRDELRQEWREKRNYFLAVEIIALALFAIDLLIRLGNPDLWHPYKGGEKPMDFSYFNAVLKSTVFPPYDPWFSGGYINYYYYGYVIVGVLVKWLGIVPTIAYNLILPTLFSLLGLGAFSIGWNLLSAAKKPPTGEEPGEFDEAQVKKKGIFAGLPRGALWTGLSATTGLLILGNLGTVRMIWQGFQKLAAPGGNIDNVSILQHWIWTIQGVGKFMAGFTLPYAPGDWYWIPSRAIPGNVITEFPFFTFLYADLHAHLIALPVTVLAISWALSIVLGKGRWGDNAGRSQWLSLGSGFLLGGLVIGALRPTNTWDFPTYLALGAVALLYSNWRYNWLASLGIGDGTSRSRRTWLALGSVVVLVGLALFLYQPYAYWYDQGYNSVIPWTGDHTPFWSYLTHWGLFLFVISSWMLWETRNWMASTPLSSLRKLRPYRELILVLAIFLVAAIVVLLKMGVGIAWLVLILAAWAGVLLLRPGLSDAKRAVLFMAGTALALTLAVEVIVLQGDIGRMNTVFKFYVQAWVLFALSAAAGLGWMIQEARLWVPGWRTAWQTALVALVAGAALFPILGGMDKITDRMAPQAPHTLDGMTYMAYSTYNEQGVDMSLVQDYDAIRWMQQNIQGSPVIVEGNTPEYQWGTRFTIYTGLPGVVGWNWHQRQQRGVIIGDTAVTDRIAEIATFYTTTDPQAAKAFLQKYNVQYIVVGQLERIFYPGPGLEKFTQYDGVYWRKVYGQGETAIYQVLP